MSLTQALKAKLGVVGIYQALVCCCKISCSHADALVVLQEQRIGVEEYEALCKGTRNLTPPPITDELSRWVNETQWSALQPLTQLQVSIAVFYQLHDTMLV